MPTVGDVVTSALTEIRAARAGDVVKPADMTLGIYLLNRLLDLWNADERKVYADRFTDFTLTPSLSPHTIGPSGTFTATVRPVRLLSAAVNLGSGVFTPLDVRDAEWYASQTVPALTSTFPTDVYYQPEFPLGKLYFWPVPTSALSVRLWTRALLASVVQTDDFSLPPGYQEALELTLAERLAPAFGEGASEETKTAARAARATIFGNNDDVSLKLTSDAPTSGNGGGWFDYRTRRSY